MINDFRKNYRVSHTTHGADQIGKYTISGFCKDLGWLILHYADTPAEALEIIKEHMFFDAEK